MRPRRRLELAARAVLRAGAREGCRALTLAPTFALIAGRGRGRPAAKLLRLRQICPSGDHAVRGGAERQGVAARLSLRFPWVFREFRACRRASLRGGQRLTGGTV